MLSPAEAAGHRVHPTRAEVPTSQGEGCGRDRRATAHDDAKAPQILPGRKLGRDGRAGMEGMTRQAVKRALPWREQRGSQGRSARQCLRQARAATDASSCGRASTRPTLATRTISKKWAALKDLTVDEGAQNIEKLANGPDECQHSSKISKTHLFGPSLDHVRVPGAFRLRMRSRGGRMCGISMRPRF